MTWPSGFYATYQYDGLDRLTLIQDQGTTTLNSFTYDGPGRIVSRADGTGGTAGSTSVTYDGVSRVATLAHDLASTGADVTWTYTANAASQLGSVARSNDSYAWAGLYTVTRNYTPNGLNQYNQIATVGGSTLTLGYDLNGNLTSDGAGGNSYTYDVENRMTGVTGAHAATLAYDPIGRLWQVTNNNTGAITQFVYDGDALIAEYNSAGSLLRRYVHGADAAADDPMVWYEGSAVQYLHVDHQGSVVAVAGSAGASVATNTYDEYGIPGASNQGRFQYTSQAWLAELGLYYYKARMYSPTLGRFMQTDPIGYADQFNLYEYVGDDPVNDTDSSGEESDAATRPDPNDSCGSRIRGNNNCNGQSGADFDARHASAGGQGRSWHTGMNGMPQPGPPPELPLDGETMATMQDSMDMRDVMAQRMTLQELGDRRQARFDGAMNGLIVVEGTLAVRGAVQLGRGYLALRAAGATRADFVRYNARSLIPRATRVGGAGERGGVRSWAIKGGGVNPVTGLRLPFQYHITRYNWWRPWTWFTYTPMR